MLLPRKSIIGIWILSILSWVSKTRSLCVPDVPTPLLSDAAVLKSPVIQDALREVERNLTAQFGGGKFSGGMSFAIFHASTTDKIYTYNTGLLKLNETDNHTPITSDSIFRVASISKSIAMLSTLIISKHSTSQPNSPLPPLTLSTPLTTILSPFHLPPTDWDLNDGRSITLSMLLSQSSGLPREGFETRFDDVGGMSRASAKFIGEMWGGATPESVVEAVGQQGLIFEVGKRASYSNAGFCLLGYGVVEYWNAINTLKSRESVSQLPETGNTSSNSSSKDNAKFENITWTQFATQEILKPLGMNHSFFGSIPEELKKEISIPGTPENWVDLLVGPGYDPAGGMYSSATDLASYLYQVFLSPIPSLITQTQRNIVLQPRVGLPDGIQSVGLGWEITRLKPQVRKATREGEGYNIFGKSGDAAAQHSLIEILPNLGYGLVILSSDGPPPPLNTPATKNTSISIQTSSLSTQIHEILIPAFRDAYSRRLGERWAGNYTLERNVSSSDMGDTTNHALVEVDNGVLYLRHLVYNNISALLRLDMLAWDSSPPSSQAVQNHPVIFGTGKGVALNPSNLRGNGQCGEKEGKGGREGQVFRMSVEGELCDYFDFDGYTDGSGWGLDMIVFEEGEGDGEGEVRLMYPPLGAVLLRKREMGVKLGWEG